MTPGQTPSAEEDHVMRLFCCGFITLLQLLHVILNKLKIKIHRVVQEMLKEDEVCEPAAMDSEDVLFLLYTSGSTGKPKGLVHTQAGYLLYVALTQRVNIKHDLWCLVDFYRTV